MDITYRNYQLRRTLPKLSGNMQLDLVVRLGSDKKAYVVGAHLRPISKLINHVPVVDERIMDRPHQMNIKKFYEATRAQFYEHIIDPRLASDWPMIISPVEMENLKYIKEFDDTYFAGTQRMAHKLYGCSHEILVPLWLDQASGLKFHIHVAMNGSEEANRTFDLDLSPVYLQAKDEKCNYLLDKRETFHNDFVRYLLDYFDYAGISGGNNHVMTVDFKQNVSTLRGIQVDTGNLMVRQNLNIARNLIFRERPLLEANSLLTNSFMDHKLIVGQLLNINICFDAQQMTAFSGDLHAEAFRNTQRFRVWVTTEVLRAQKDIKQKYYRDPEWTDDTTYAWQKMELRDFYTNHHYVPKIMVDADISTKSIGSYEDKDNIQNALDYKKDYLCTDIIHQNKMAQSICHWLYAQQPDSDQLFNVYDGFGSYGTDGVEYGHGFGATPDINDDTFNEAADNTIWAGIPVVETGDGMANYLQYPHNKTEFFKDASNFMNGIKFGYNPTNANYSEGRQAPKAMYVGTMTSPWTVGDRINWSKQVTRVMAFKFIGIMTDRAGESIPVNILPKSQNEQDKTDMMYDLHMHSDSDNRWVVKKIYKGKDCRIWFDPTGKYMKKNQYIWLPADTEYKTDVTAELKEQLGEDWLELGVSENIYASMLMRVGGSSSVVELSTRDDDNTNILFVGYTRGRDFGSDEENYTPRPDDPLYVIFYHGRTRVPEGMESLVYRNLNPNGLTLGGVIKALRDYQSKYGAISDILDVVRENEPDVDVPGPDILPDMEDFGSIADTFTSIEAPEIIFFSNSIIPHQDITLSPRAKEHTYYKISNANAYVLRYSGAIKPCLYPEKTERIKSDKKLVYHGWYGRNFLWQKKPIFSIGQTFPTNLGTYIGRNVPPYYPSLDYDTVQPLVIADAGENVGKSIPAGDLRYDEVPPFYLGFTDEGLDKSDLDYTRYCDNNELMVSDGLGEPNIQFGREYVRTGKLNPQNFENHKIQPYDIGYWLYKDQYGTYEWPEYKWFDKSRICLLPAEVEMFVDSDSNDKSTLEITALGQLLVKLNQKNIDYDRAFLKNTYDFEYNLLSVEPQKNGAEIVRDERTDEVLYKYRYQIKATLK